MSNCLSIRTSRKNNRCHNSECSQSLSGSHRFHLFLSFLIYPALFFSSSAVCQNTIVWSVFLSAFGGQRSLIFIDSDYRENLAIPIESGKRKLVFVRNRPCSFSVVIINHAGSVIINRERQVIRTRRYHVPIMSFFLFFFPHPVSGAVAHTRAVAAVSCKNPRRVIFFILTVSF